MKRFYEAGMDALGHGHGHGGHGGGRRGFRGGWGGGWGYPYDDDGDTYIINVANEDVLGKSGGGGGGHGGGGHGGHHGGGGGGFRGGWGGPGWGWGWPGYYDGGDTYVVNYVDADDDEDDDVLGMIDIKARQDELNKFKNVPVSVAQVLVKYAQQVIDHAIAAAKQPWYKSDLPGETERNNVKAHLQWHADALAKLASTPSAFYASGDDLKKFAMMAYVDANSVEEGSAYLDVIWGAMWAEITNALAALPKEIADKVSDVIPTWAKWTIGIGAGAVALIAGVALYDRVRG